VKDGIEPELGFRRSASRGGRWDSGIYRRRGFVTARANANAKGRQRAKREGGRRCGARKRKGASTRTESLLFANAIGFSHTWAWWAFLSSAFRGWTAERETWASWSHELYGLAGCCGLETIGEAQK
jgi:hypothetical protein